ncbi:hypothetical protein TSUD_325820 [Trifolium subterraneum]|uniref:CAP-Gly domain-containing protein n=1 Tax=Trifolium subterraneum TaxID=3900 RepID=A0A2Z6M492_TRISU|nr:hypothetical protein TSUD_325820 [Trifolium subterraneum]
MEDSPNQTNEFNVGQRVHSSGDSTRIGTVKYVGNVEGYPDTWVGIDWDYGGGKHDGSINNVRYFHAKSEKSGSFVRPKNLCKGISLLQALEKRYRKEMYVLSTSNKKVSIELLGTREINDKLSRFEELTNASLAYMGVSSPGIPCELSTTVPNIKELDLSGNLLSEWKDVGFIFEQLPALKALNLSYNSMSPYKSELPLLKSIRVLVLNNTGVDWEQVELLRQSLTTIEELHIMGNNISRILPVSSSMVQGFDSLRLLNLEDNCIAEWSEIMKLSQLRCLEQLYLNKNCLSSLFYPDNGCQYYESEVTSCKPFQNLRCLLLGDNNISDLASVDSLNLFPNLVDIRLSGNPITDATKGGVPRFVLIARLAEIQILNGSEITSRERKDSEIRHVLLKTMFLLLLSWVADWLVITWIPLLVNAGHILFSELKNFYGIEDQKPLIGATGGPQAISSGFLSITLKCVGASMGEKQPMTKKLPATTTGSPLPLLLDNDASSLMDHGVGNDSVILVDEDS